jgi:hypothetical protein
MISAVSSKAATSSRSSPGRNSAYDNNFFTHMPNPDLAE